MLAALLYAIGQGEGIIKVVGEVGRRQRPCCAASWRPTARQRRQRLSQHPTLSPDDMLAAILADLGSTRQAGGSGWQQLNAILLARHEADGAWWCSSRKRRASR
jgi:hypothetical protein